MSCEVHRPVSVNPANQGEYRGNPHRGVRRDCTGGNSDRFGQTMHLAGAGVEDTVRPAPMVKAQSQAEMTWSLASARGNSVFPIDASAQVRAVRGEEDRVGYPAWSPDQLHEVRGPSCRVTGSDYHFAVSVNPSTTSGEYRGNLREQRVRRDCTRGPSSEGEDTVRSASMAKMQRAAEMTAPH